MAPPAPSPQHSTLPPSELNATKFSLLINNGKKEEELQFDGRHDMHLKRAVTFPVPKHSNDDKLRSNSKNAFLLFFGAANLVLPVKLKLLQISWCVCACLCPECHPKWPKAQWPNHFHCKLRTHLLACICHWHYQLIANHFD